MLGIDSAAGLRQRPARNMPGRPDSCLAATRTYTPVSCASRPLKLPTLSGWSLCPAPTAPEGQCAASRGWWMMRADHGYCLRLSAQSKIMGQRGARGARWPGEAICCPCGTAGISTRTRTTTGRADVRLGAAVGSQPGAGWAWPDSCDQVFSGRPPAHARSALGAGLRGRVPETSFAPTSASAGHDAGWTLRMRKKSAG